MGAVAIIGAQWGDEGKGKVVDLLAEQADVVVRYAGGPNAGHTLVVGDDKLVFRLVPSGVLHAHTQCVLGQGMVINPEVLLDEIAALTGRGLSVEGRLHLSELSRPSPTSSTHRSQDSELPPAMSHFSLLLIVLANYLRTVHTRRTPMSQGSSSLGL